jgi:hypothetical protein
MYPPYRDVHAMRCDKILINQRSAAFKKAVPIEVYPIIGVCGLAVGGATYYLYRLSQGSEVVWDRSGDWRPWDKVS